MPANSNGGGSPTDAGCHCEWSRCSLGGRLRPLPIEPRQFNSQPILSLPPEEPHKALRTCKEPQYPLSSMGGSATQCLLRTHSRQVQKRASPKRSEEHTSELQ